MEHKNDLPCAEPLMEEDGLLLFIDEEDDYSPYDPDIRSKLGFISIYDKDLGPPGDKKGEPLLPTMGLYLVSPPSKARKLA